MIRDEKRQILHLLVHFSHAHKSQETQTPCISTTWVAGRKYSGCHPLLSKTEGSWIQSATTHLTWHSQGSQTPKQQTLIFVKFESSFLNLCRLCVLCSILSCLNEYFRFLRLKLSHSCYR